jgi:hypothetical protein
MKYVEIKDLQELKKLDDKQLEKTKEEITQMLIDLEND